MAARRKQPAKSTRRKPDPAPPPPAAEEPEEKEDETEDEEEEQEDETEDEADAEEEEDEDDEEEKAAPVAPEQEEDEDDEALTLAEIQERKLLKEEAKRRGVTLDFLLEERKLGEKADKIAAVRFKDVETVVTLVQKNHGKGSLSLMTEHNLELARISTGVLDLDLKLGGGIPKGRIVEFFGPEQSGKTTRQAATIAKAQRTCMNCNRRARFVERGKIKVPLPGGESIEVPRHLIADCPCGNPRQAVAAWVDIEAAFDPVWFQRQGVWLEHCYLSRPQVLEEAIDVVQALMESDQFNVIGFDSIAMGIPAAELENETSKELPGIAARLWGKGMRKWLVMQIRAYRRAYDAGDNEAINRIPSILMINETRMKIGVMFGNPETTPGGNAPRFAGSVRIRCASAGTKSPAAKKKEGGDGGGGEVADENDPTWHVLAYTVKKSRVSPAGAKGEYRLVQKATEFHQIGEIDQERDLVEYGIKSGVIAGQPQNYTLDCESLPKNVLEKRFRGKSEMERFFGLNKDAFQTVYDEIVYRMTGVRY